MNFNSHAHVERDAATAIVEMGRSLISTHTLTWSVTMPAHVLLVERRNFNSHAHVERDDFKRLDYFRLFISTHTLTWSVTRQGRERRIIMTISTHTLTWSVTPASRYALLVFPFQLTRSRGA